MASLPFEIITEILTRLPVKPLIRFKCVSKPWNSLISSPKFTKHHLISNPNTKNLVFMYKGTLCTATLFNSDTNSNNLRVTELNHPFKRLSHRPDVGLVESINGVLFMLDTPNKETLLLYNPSIDSCRLIPDRTPPPANLLCYEEVFGFGYDSLHDDYKVVRLQQWKVHGFGLSKEASVYSLRDNVWKSVKDETMPFFLQMSHGVAGNEMLHFPTLTMSFEAVLKCFDLRTNALLIVDYPELDTDDLGKMNMSPMELRGRFTLLVSYRKQSGMSMRHPLETGGFKYADLWEMRERGKKESWVKLFRIKKSEIVERCGFLRLVTYSKDERYVLLEVNGKRFGWYDLVSKRMEKVAVQGIEPDNDAPYVATTFVESLFSLSDKVVPKGGTNDKAARRSLLRRLRRLGRGSSLRFDQIRIITDRAWYNVRCGY